MEYVLCAIRDSKSDTYTPPSCFRHSGQAIRAFIDNIKQPQQDQVSQLMSRYPGDYDLYELGKFNDETGQFLSNEKPTLLYSGSNT